MVVSAEHLANRFKDATLHLANAVGGAADNLVSLGLWCYVQLPSIPSKRRYPMVTVALLVRLEAKPGITP